MASRLARISLTYPADGVTGFSDGVPPALLVPKEAFSNRARVAANDVSRFTWPSESLSALALVSDGDR